MCLEMPKEMGACETYLYYEPYSSQQWLNALLWQPLHLFTHINSKNISIDSSLCFNTLLELRVSSYSCYCS